MRTEGAVAFVTGGGALGHDGHYGVGHAVATQLARTGATVVVADLSPERAQITIDEIRGAGGKAEGATVDVTNWTSVSTVIDGVAERHGRLDFLVNCVGKSAARGPFAASDPTAWEQTLDINLRSVLFCSRAALPHMIRQGGGRIVSISSDAGKSGAPGQALYSAAKGAIAAFTRALAQEVAAQGVTANVVSPGAIDNAPFRERMAKPEFQDFVSSTLARMPIGRLVAPAEIAAMILFLLSPEAAALTGQTISVNGGALCTP